MTPSRLSSLPPEGFRYAPRSGVYDEAFLPDGAPRPHHHELWRGLEGLGSAEIAKRWDQGRRLIRENGVTYNVYGDPRGRIAVGADPCRGSARILPALAKWLDQARAC